MNDVQRKILEEKIKTLCNNCETVFDEQLGVFIENKIDEITGFVLRRDQRLCWNCRYFVTPHDSQFQEVAGN